MKKKLISVLLAVLLLLSCMSASISAFATTRPIQLDVKVTNILDGAGDMNWYTFTPVASGTYSFLSYNVPASEAYLFVKEKDPETGKKVYKQLEFSNSDPNYQENGHNILQFCLTYYLEKGVTYYYAAGWSFDYTIDKATAMTVMLRCDEYYEKIVDSIELSCPSVLSAYVDGNWTKDPSGLYSYFYYDISKIIANMKITVNYADGRTSTVIGKDQIDGYDILFKHTQSENHWYPQETPEYTANTLTIKIADASVDFDVPIKINAMYAVTGTIVDTNGDPVENARILNNATNSLITTTDSNGSYYFATNSGQLSITISGESVLSRQVQMTIGAQQSGNDFAPIEVVNLDYVNDGTINAKDLVHIIKNFSGSELESKQQDFDDYINFDKSDYPSLSLTAQ